MGTIQQLSTYIHHNYRFRSECNGSFYFWSNFLCMSSRIRCWYMFRIRLGMAYTLDAFYRHNNPLDSYSSISLRRQNVRYDMLCTAFPMNHCTLDTTNDMMHSYTKIGREREEKNTWNKQIKLVRNKLNCGHSFFYHRIYTNINCNETAITLNEYVCFSFGLWNDVASIRCLEIISHFQ